MLKNDIRFITALFLIIVGIAFPSHAQERSEDEIFCFRHVITEAMVFQCFNRNDIDSGGNEIYCYDDVKNTYVKFEKTDQWEKETGPQCIPSYLKIRTPDIPTIQKTDRFPTQLNRKEQIENILEETDRLKLKDSEGKHE